MKILTYFVFYVAVVSTAQATPLTDPSTRIFQCDQQTKVYLTETDCDQYRTRLGEEWLCTGNISIVKSMQSQPEWNGDFTEKSYPGNSRLTTEDVSFQIGTAQGQFTITEYFKPTLVGEVSDGEKNVELKCEETTGPQPAGPAEHCYSGPGCNPRACRAC